MPRTSDNYDYDTNRDSAKDIIWSSGIKATPSRMAIVRVLFSEKKPISIADLHEKVKIEIPKINSTSIYRTLESLVESGDVQRIDTHTPHASYEIKHGRKHHHHIICKKCGDVEDVDLCPINIRENAHTSTQILSSKKFSIINEHSLEFFGICDVCSNNNI